MVAMLIGTSRRRDVIITDLEVAHGNDYGYMFNNKWLNDKAKWYYFNSNGEMATSKRIILNVASATALS